MGNLGFEGALGALVQWCVSLAAGFMARPCCTRIAPPVTSARHSSVCPAKKTTAPRRLPARHSSPQAQAFRGRIILRCGQGDRPTDEEAAREFDCDPGTVGKWRSRFAAERFDGLADLPRERRPEGFFPRKTGIRALVLATTKPTEFGLPISHWSLEDLAVRILQDAHYRDVSKNTIGASSTPTTSSRIAASNGCTATTRTSRRKRCTSPHSIWTPHACTNTANWCCASMKRPASRPWSGMAPAGRWNPAPRTPGVRVHPPRHRRSIARLLVPTGPILGDVGARLRPAGILAGTCGIRPSSFRTACGFHWVDNLNTQWNLSLCRCIARLSGARFEPKRPWTGAERRAFLTDPEHKHVIHYPPKHGSQRRPQDCMRKGLNY